MGTVIAPELQQFAVPIHSLKPHPRNPRHGDVPALVASLRHFGQLKAVTSLAATDQNELPNGTIIAGHHIWYAASEDGWDEIAAVALRMSDEQALAFLIADNRTSELGCHDEELLASVLSDIPDLTGVGYTDEQVQELVDSLEVAPDPAPPEPNVRVCPNCGFVIE